jgi:hypothetical protein
VPHRVDQGLPGGRVVVVASGLACGGVIIVAGTRNAYALLAALAYYAVPGNSRAIQAFRFQATRDTVRA